ncbi:hypothetical protein [Sphingomonas daechungensis]|uniref:hypothetical protein n=1 Tax=Sphingomonas daechungensis TaxID=1176646 RepID=UPI003783A90D
MDFHPPKAIQSIKELPREILVIVLGVSIALVGESLVDGYRWREKVTNAEEEMKLELLADNGPQAFVRVAIAKCLDSSISRIHESAETASAPELRKLAHAYAPPFRTWDTEAWKALLASDVASHMDPARLVDWSEPYRLFPIMTQWSQLESELVTELQEGLPISGDLSREDLHQFQRTAASLRRVNAKLASKSKLVLVRLKKNGMPLPESEMAELLEKARGIYGDCVRAPVVDGEETESEFTNEAEMRREALEGS